VRVQCPLRLEAVIRTIAGMEGTYPEVVDVVQQADATRTLSCRVVHDALPQAVSLQELAGLGSGKAGDAAPDLGPTPTLFEGGRRPAQPATTEGAE